MDTYCVKLLRRPPLFQDQQEIFWIPKKLVEKNDELAVTLALMANRRLFGLCYRGLMPRHFEKMGKGSGVMIAPVVPTAAIAPDVKFPGDIDLLIIPYADDNLILSDTLAIEIKVVRAKYARQGKAPNEFGFSQANAIFTHGVPYSAVVHLVVSDTSPEDQWRGMHAANVIDVHAGSIGPLYPIQIDMMPADLIDRSFGRLSANCPHDSLGLVAAYISFNDSGWWQPMARRALRNTNVSRSFLAGVEKYYTENYSIFLDTPKYPPSR